MMFLVLAKLDIIRRKILKKNDMSDLGWLETIL